MRTHQNLDYSPLIHECVFSELLNAVLKLAHVLSYKKYYVSRTHIHNNDHQSIMKGSETDCGTTNKRSHLRGLAPRIISVINT